METLACSLFARLPRQPVMQALHKSPWGTHSSSYPGHLLHVWFESHSSHLFHLSWTCSTDTDTCCHTSCQGQPQWQQQQRPKHHDPPLTRGSLLFLALSAHGLCISSLCLFIPLQPDSVLTIPFYLDLWRLLACVKFSGLVFILILLNLQQRSAFLYF